MNNNLFVNDLIEWIDSNPPNLIERVLWIDSGYNIAFVFDINAKKGFPEAKKVSEIRVAIHTEQALKLKQDPWARHLSDEDLTKIQKDYRENAWSLISSLVEKEPDIYYRSSRGSLIKQVVEQYNQGRSENKLVEKTVYEYLRRFWQRGKNQNALLPDYSNCGGLGKPKKCGEKKRGRPRKYAHEPEIGVGINVTDDDLKIFRISIAKFYNNDKQNSLRTTYKLMIREYYSSDIRYDENGVKKSLLIPPELRPTFTQLKYWYEVELSDIKKSITERKGAKRFALEHRAILGTSKMETIGPGSRYQIDATIADVYLVSKYNSNWIIGRPVIYVIIDVFSRMIVGVYVGLEGPSWTGAMMALANAATDKIQFCQEYGINISSTEWPCHHLPDAILGDRGELAGMAVETLIPNLNVRIENAAPYRADWKGLVERYFRTIHGHVKPFLPGYIDTDFRQRGGRDYRLDSRVDIEQFTEIIIHLIRYHNNHHYLASYDREEMMITDNVNPIPIELWKWGIENRSGRLRTFPEDIIKLNLMPSNKATITARGIKFKGMYYSCEKALKEFWFEKARSNLLSKSDKLLDISYDYRKPNFIYVRSPDGRDFEKCFLLDPEERYSQKNIHDIEYLLAYEEWLYQKSQGNELQACVDLIADIENVVNRANDLASGTVDNRVSDNQKVAGIRGNRASEKAKRRDYEGFELAKTETPIPETVMPSKNSDSKENKSLQPDHLELLRKKRQEHFNEHRE
jgi:hypothetical protein